MTRWNQGSARRYSALVGAAALTALVWGTQASAEVSYMEDVWPIFKARCIECHSADNVKGDLRLDSPEEVKAGGTFGPVLEAGKPDESVLVELISLPEDDGDRMPNEGEPLSDEQIATIRTWIDEGASFDGWDPEAAGVMPEEKEPTLLETLGEGVEPAPEDAVAAVEDAGALIMPLGENTNLLRVNFQLMGKDATDEHLKLLEPLSNQITWLNLAGTSVTNEGLAALAELPKLTMLHLERTGIGDAGLKHVAGLEHLQYLNLYNTKVSDAGLEHLHGLAKIEKLYLWQSDVTPDGAESIRAALPEAEVNMGTELAIEEESDTEGETEEGEEAAEEENKEA